MARLDRPDTTGKKTKTSALSKISPTELRPIQFKVSADLHYEYKMYALENHITMTDLFVKMYEEYKDNND